MDEPPGKEGIGVLFVLGVLIWPVGGRETTVQRLRCSILLYT